jgi:hypothetical protein
MGYNSSATTLSLNARLTPLGRQLLVSTNNTLITGFSLGDSDANYNVTNILGSGQIPTNNGNIGPNSTISNGANTNSNIKSVLIADGQAMLIKSVETQSTLISTESIHIGTTTVSGTNLTQNYINRNDFTIDPLVNLYYSFGLPLNLNDDTIYTGITYNEGGLSDTALSGIAQTKILTIGIDNSQYGEVIDGKTIMLNLPTTAGTYTIYSSFQNKGGGLQTEDANIRDTSLLTSYLGNNIAFLFSDTIMTPNGGDITLSWSDGYNTNKPFSLNRKQLYNLQTNSNLAQSADTIVGIAYLDKGFLVITDPTIINTIDSNNLISGVTTGATVTFNSVSTSVSQTITCVAGRGEFGTSTNPTFTSSDTPRISEVGLYDELGNLIAMSKTDRHITKNVNEFLALSIKIEL